MKAEGAPFHLVIKAKFLFEGNRRGDAQNSQFNKDLNETIRKQMEKLWVKL